MGKGLKAFVAAGFSPRNIQQKSTAYTMLLTDDQLSATTALTVTLPVIATMIGTVVGKKLYRLKASSGYALTVSPGSGNTISGRASFVIPPNQSIIIGADQGDTDWEIVFPDTSQGITGEGRLRQTVVVATTSGTTPVHVFSSAGAPTTFIVESVKVTGLDTTASNIVLKNGTATVATVAKGTASGLITGAASLANTAYSVAATCTVESSGTGNALVEIGIVNV